MLPTRNKLGRHIRVWLAVGSFGFGCTGSDEGNIDTAVGATDTGSLQQGDTGEADTAGIDTGSEPCDPPDYGEPGDPFADVVVDYVPGEGAGFGQEAYPEIVLGPPRGEGKTGGSLDVLSLGEFGEIILEFTDRQIVDGDGIDVVIFENPFPAWVEPAAVAASPDGIEWTEWDCDLDDPDYSGCAGILPVLSHPDNCIDATDPSVAGGDGFDLAEIGLESARFLRIRDLGVTGPDGFDLDAVAVVNGEALLR